MTESKPPRAIMPLETVRRNSGALWLWIQYAVRYCTSGGSIPPKGDMRCCEDEMH